MKKIKLPILLLLLTAAAPAWAQEGKVMQIHSNGNVVYEIATAQVDSVTFRAEMKICNVENPLQNIEWLKEYCESLQEREDISGFDVILYKVIGTGEHIFFIRDETKHPMECHLGGPQYYLSSRLNCMNCNGDIVFHRDEWDVANNYCYLPDDFEGMYRQGEFLKGKEFVAELYRYDKP